MSLGLILVIILVIFLLGGFQWPVRRLRLRLRPRRHRCPRHHPDPRRTASLGSEFDPTGGMSNNARLEEVNAAQVEVGAVRLPRESLR